MPDTSLNSGEDQNQAASIETPADNSITSNEEQVSAQKNVDSGTSSSNQSQTSAKTETEETFFDPKSLDPALMPAYNQMRKAFTQKTQKIAADRQKIEAYDSFTKDPMGQIKQIASQYGYELNHIGQKSNNQQVHGNQQQDWEPQSWDDVFHKIESRVLEKMGAQLQPVFNTVQQVTASNIERQLDEIDPQWRVYEDDMRETLKEHPTLVKNISQLYRLSVPEEVINSKATQVALKKLENKVNASKIHTCLPVIVLEIHKNDKELMEFDAYYQTNLLHDHHQALTCNHIPFALQ